MDSEEKKAPTPGGVGVPTSKSVGKNDEDDVVEFEFNDDGEEDLKKTLKKLRADLKACQREKEEYLTGWQKERADFANYKKDEAERAKRTATYAEERVILDLLPALDSYDLAFSNREAWEKVDKSWRTGVEYIHQQIIKALGEYGVVPFGEVGESFDHNLHHSLDKVETDKENLDHTVASVIQKGYKAGDRILRPANVNIYEYKGGK